LGRKGRRRIPQPEYKAVEIGVLSDTGRKEEARNARWQGIRAASHP
jgi:hypothetical protein